MNIVFLTRLYHPHIGGVEKHVHRVTEELQKKGHEVTIITTREQKQGKQRYSVLEHGSKVIRLNIPEIKVIGLFWTWLWVVFHVGLFRKADVVHAHDVAIWLAPLKIFFPKKPIHTTMHGWEGKYPIPYKNILLKKLARKMSKKVIGVGEYIQKYYKVKLDKVVWGGVDLPKAKGEKEKKLVFVGRLDHDTGVEQFVRKIPKYKGYEVEFYGAGSLKDFCATFGPVHGVVDPTPAYKSAEYIFAGGYLTALEALSHGCKVLVGADNPLKKDYWDEFPPKKYFKKPKLFKKVAKNYTWAKLAEEYHKLWSI